MKRFLVVSGGMFLIVSMIGCCYRPAYIDQMTGIPYGGNWEPTPVGPMDPTMYLGDPAYSYGASYSDLTPYSTVPYSTVPYSTVPYSTVPSTVPSSIGSQPILPGCPLWGLFHSNPLAWLFGWGPWNTPYGYGYGGVVSPDCCGGGQYQTTPPTYLLPAETLIPQPAPAAEEKSEQSSGTPTSFVAPALLQK